jgi:epoxyqueuosine reductase
MNLENKIKQKAFDLGFDLVGITDAGPIDTENINLLTSWLKAGFAGQMQYMHKNFEKRTDPKKLAPFADSIICVALNYKPPQTKSDPKQHLVSIGKVANFAQYQDYHRFMKKQLYKLAEYIKTHLYADLEFKICVDSAPVAERVLAARAGLGFIGKNHMLIHPDLGLQILLGEILVNLSLKPDKPLKNHCPSCEKCINACPTAALSADGRFDAKKCISYLTIELKNNIPPEMAKKIGTRVFGCDECILACPYNLNAPLCKNKLFKPFPQLSNLDLNQILDMSVEQFDRKFSDTTVHRTGLKKLKLNAKNCLENSKDTSNSQ